MEDYEGFYIWKNSLGEVYSQLHLLGVIWKTAFRFVKQVICPYLCGV
jgi:hypothetical protein